MRPRKRHKIPKRRVGHRSIQTILRYADRSDGAAAEIRRWRRGGHREPGNGPPIVESGQSPTTAMTAFAAASPNALAAAFRASPMRPSTPSNSVSVPARLPTRTAPPRRSNSSLIVALEPDETWSSSRLGVPTGRPATVPSTLPSDAKVKAIPDGVISTAPNV